MKKLIGVVIIMLTLVLSVIYRQLTQRPVKHKPEQAYVPVSLRDGMLLSFVLFQ